MKDLREIAHVLANTDSTVEGEQVFQSYHPDGTVDYQGGQRRMATIIPEEGTEAPSAAMSQVGDSAAAIFDALPNKVQKELGEVGWDCSMTAAAAATLWRPADPTKPSQCVMRPPQVFKAVLMFNQDPIQSQKKDQVLHTDVSPEGKDEPVAIMPVEEPVRVGAASPADSNSFGLPSCRLTRVCTSANCLQLLISPGSHLAIRAESALKAALLPGSSTQREVDEVDESVQDMLDKRLLKVRVT
jgi:hypothetical protein